MSSQLITKKILVLTGFIAVLALTITLLSEKKHKTISFKQRKFTHTSKVTLPISVNIISPNEESLDPGTAMTLTGTISSYRGLKGLVYSWSLPEGVQLVSGSLNGNISNLKANDEKHFSIAISVEDYSNRQIHFKVKSLDRKMRFSKTAQYNTLHTEDNFDRDAAESEILVSE